MKKTEHIMTGVLVGLLLTLTWIVLVPERYEVKAKAQVSENIRSDRSAAVNSAAALVKAREVNTSFGTLLLVYANGQARLTGNLSKGISCATWQTQVVGTDGYPPALEFILESSDGEGMCLQALSEKQIIDAKAHAASISLYLVRVNGEVVFAGTLSPPSQEPGGIVYFFSDLFSFA